MLNQKTGYLQEIQEAADVSVAADRAYLGAQFWRCYQFAIWLDQQVPGLTCVELCLPMSKQIKLGMLQSAPTQLDFVEDETPTE